MRGSGFVVVLAAAVACPCGVTSGQCDDKLLAELHAPSPKAGDYFGGGVAIEGNRLVVLALSAEAFVFELQGATWVLAATITGPPGTTYFSSVALDGDRILIGSGVALVGGVQTGAAFIYELQGATWVLVATLTAPNAAAFDDFGTSVALEEDVAVVSAPGADAGSVLDAGLVHVFQHVAGSWSHAHQIEAVDPTTSASFGRAVALWQDRLVVGARRANGASLLSGAVYVYGRHLGAWSQVAKLMPPGTTQGDQVGFDVAVHGTTIAIGGNEEISGVWVYEEVSPFWVLSDHLFPTQVPNMGFGPSVALDGDTLVVGSPRDDQVAWDAGATYVFERTPSGWVDTLKLLRPDGVQSDLLGYAVALSGDIAVLGAPYVDVPGLGDSVGAVYVFSTIPNPLPEYGTGCAGSGGYVPTLSVDYSYDGCFAPSDNVNLVIENALGGSFAVLFLGGSPAEVPMQAGCSLLLNLAPLAFLIPLSGSGPGAGEAYLAATIPPNASLGSVYLQAFIADPGVPHGYSNTNGARVTIH